MVTGCAGIIWKDGLILMGKSKKHGGWVFPGGRMKDSEMRPEETLRREIREEAGIEIKNVIRLATYDPQEGMANKVIMHNAEYASGDIRPGDDIEEVGFFHPFKVLKLPLTPFTRQLVEEYLSKLSDN